MTAAPALLFAPALFEVVSGAKKRGVSVATLTAEDLQPLVGTPCQLHLMKDTADLRDAEPMALKAIVHDVETLPYAYPNATRNPFSLVVDTVEVAASPRHLDSYV